MARKSRRSSRRRSRRRRGGMSTDNAEFKAKMDNVATQANKTIVDANTAMASANKAKMDTMNMARAARVSGIPSNCKNPFMKGSKKCKMAAKKMIDGAKVLKGTSEGIKKRANSLKSAGLKVGGRKSRRSRRSRRGGRKSRRSRRSRRGGRKSRRSRRSRRGGRKSRKSRRSRRGGRKSRRSRRSRR